VACNLAALNGMEGIVVIDEGRRSDEGDLEPSGNQIIANIVAWNHRDRPGRPGLTLPSNGKNSSDWNIFISDQPDPLFSLDWPTILNPPIRGLAAWQTKSRQDIHSWSKTMPLPSEIQRALTGRQREIDWSSIEKIAFGNSLGDSVRMTQDRCSVPGPFGRTSANSDHP
jgi:hypothetical protein